MSVTNQVRDFLGPINSLRALVSALEVIVKDHGNAINNLLLGETPIVLTANLPAAGAAQNGRVLIEDAGAGNRNIIVYAGGERFRIDGGAAF